MNANHDPLQRRIDAALDRLPQWDPPAGFAQRLAAAAHRQQRELARPRPSMRFGWLLLRISGLVLLLLGGGLVVAVSSFAVPWRALVAQPLQLTVLCIAVMLAAGALLTQRMLFGRRIAGR